MQCSKEISRTPVFHSGGCPSGGIEGFYGDNVTRKAFGILLVGRNGILRIVAWTSLALSDYLGVIPLSPTPVKTPLRFGTTSSAGTDCVRTFGWRVGIIASFLSTGISLESRLLGLLQPFMLMEAQEGEPWAGNSRTGSAKCIRRPRGRRKISFYTWQMRLTSL